MHGSLRLEACLSHQIAVWRIYSPFKWPKRCIVCQS